MHSRKMGGLLTITLITGQLPIGVVYLQKVLLALPLSLAEQRTGSSRQNVLSGASQLNDEANPRCCHLGTVWLRARNSCTMWIVSSVLNGN